MIRWVILLFILLIFINIFVGELQSEQVAIKIVGYLINIKIKKLY